MNKPLSIDELKKLVDSFPKNPVCGVVFRSSIKEAILAAISIERSEDFFMKMVGGIPVFFDNEQQEDCIVFEDRELLNAYLKRQEDPRTWATELVKRLPNQKSLEDINQVEREAMKTRIPAYLPKPMMPYPW